MTFRLTTRRSARLTPRMGSEGQISDLLETLAAQPGDRITLREIVDHFGDRAIGAMMVVFAAPLVLPMPPGLSAILGLPLVVVTAQLTLRSSRPWLPRALAARSVRRADLQGVVRRALPLLIALEKLLRRRLTWVLFPLARRLVGLVSFLLAMIVFLPIPFGNMFPSLGIAVLGLGLVERDGLAVLVGWLVAVASLIFLAVISNALLAATVTFFSVLARPFFG
jgi:hypothetical protein